MMPTIPPPLHDAWRFCVGRLQRAARVVRRVVGVPDYDAYLQHAWRAHPGAPTLSREEFVQRCWEEKYSRPGHRCC